MMAICYRALDILTSCYAKVLQETCGNTSAADINALTVLLYHAKFTGITSCSLGAFTAATTTTTTTIITIYY